MIEESTLTDDNIKEELLCRYNMRVNNVEVINNGSASIYKVHSDNGIYHRFQYLFIYNVQMVIIILYIMDELLLYKISLMEEYLIKMKETIKSY